MMEPQKSTSDSKEIKLDGIPVSRGIVIGKGFLYRKDTPVIEAKDIEESGFGEEKHIERFKNAKDIIERELKRLRSKKINEESIDIIDAQIEIINDPDLHAKVLEHIRSKRFAVGYAIQQVFESFLQIMRNSENHAAKERIVDIEDIRDRLIQVACNHSLDLNIEPGSVIIAKDVSPREVIQFSDYDIKGIVVERGGKSSHASIIARSMGIPSIVGAKRASKLLKQGGVDVVLDGNDGVLIINPGDSTRKKYDRKLKDQKKHVRKLEKILKKPSVTSDGHPFILRANIEFIEELSNIDRYRADGIGLLRTESVFMRPEHFKDPDKQEKFYTEILEETGNKPVTIRLFDAGGDKFLSTAEKENNPFLGWRGIRMLLDERDLLKQQLRSILKVAGKYPDRVRILIPMVTVLDELIEIKEILFNVEGDLIEEGIQVDDHIKLGIMVEVPSVVLQADEFANHVDFFSIGSNDLTQYTLAVDRGNEMISDLYQQTHPVIWKLIKKTYDAAEKANIGISVCGEMASYPVAAASLVGMGIVDLSMSPASIPNVKSVLTGRSADEMKNLTELVLNAVTSREVKNIFDEWSKNS